MAEGKIQRRRPYPKRNPDFAELSKNYTFLAPYVTVVNGRGHIDFKNKDALRALSRAILLEDFGLDVIIPIDTLVPMIPQRLNYILWIEEIFNHYNEQLRGLDVGTGGTAIYALLCARKNNWKMVGTDIVAESINFAKTNIARNGMEDLVHAQLTQEDSSGNFFSEVDGHFHFSMCNPPFFSSEEETDSLGKSRKLDRPLPSAAKTGTLSELVAIGGEINFLHHMITESQKHASKVGIFTTMVGIKDDLKFLKTTLKANNALGHITTEFVQGKTMRWGLAWTFDQKYVSLLLPHSRPSKISPPIQVKINCTCPIKDFEFNIKRLLNDLEFQFINTTIGCIEVLAKSNTWSNQRRKRRAALRNPDFKEQSNLKSTKIEYSITGVDETVCMNNSTFEFTSGDIQNCDEKEVVLHFQMTFQTEVNVANTRIFSCKFINGSSGVDGVHQVVQYLRNKYVSHICNISNSPNTQSQ